MPLLTQIDKKSEPVTKNTIHSLPTTIKNPYNNTNLQDCMLPPIQLQRPSLNQVPISQSVTNYSQQRINQSTPNNTYGYNQPVSQTVSKPRKNRVFGNGQELRKGQKVVLPTTSNLKICVGWDIKDSRCDVDISSFMLNDARKVISDDWFVFYGMDTSPDGSCKLNVNGTASDDKCVDINMNKINANVSRIIFVLTIDEALTRRLNFSMIEDAYIRVLDGNNELYRFTLTEYYDTVTSMMLGEIYKHNGTWKFAPIGDGVNKDLAGLCAMYGVQTD